MKLFTIRETTVICITTLALSSPALLASELSSNLTDDLNNCARSTSSITHDEGSLRIIAEFDKDQRHYYNNCCVAKTCCGGDPA